MTTVITHVESNGLSSCCHAHPYRVDARPWRCGKCYRDCDRYIPQRQDSLTDQMRDVARLAVEAGCYDAHDWLVRFFPSAIAPERKDRAHG